MVLSVILNPFVEVNVKAKKLNQGETNFVIPTNKISGGRGINASRVIKKLGGDVTTLSIIGGKNGEFIKESLREENLDFQYVLSDEENPLHIKIFDERGVETDIIESDPTISPVDIKNYEEKFREIIDKYSVILLTDRTPNGICHDIFKHLIDIAKDKNKITILDAKNDFLKEGLLAEPTITRIDKIDFDNLTGSSFVSIIKRFKTYIENKPGNFLIHIDKNNLIFNYEEKYYNILSKDLTGNLDDKVVKDIFDGVLSYYLDNGKDIYDSIQLAFLISLKGNLTDISKPKSLSDVYKEVIIREI
ncbi:MAG: PfkB family carbohydrate kinase [Caldisericia bacterium]